MEYVRRSTNRGRDGWARGSATSAGELSRRAVQRDGEWGRVEGLTQQRLLGERSGGTGNEAATVRVRVKVTAVMKMKMMKMQSL